MSNLFKDFDWKNDEFNQTQLDYLELYAATQVEALLRCDTNEKKAEKHLALLIEKSDGELDSLREKRIIWHDSPESAIKAVRSSVWDSIKDSVWGSIESSIRGSIGNLIRNSVRNSVWDSIESSVKTPIRNSVWGSIESSIRGSIGNLIGNSVWDSIRDSTESSVRGSIGNSVDSWVWSGSHSLKFFSQEMQENAIEHWCWLAEETTGSIVTDNAIHLIRKPVRLVRNDSGRLHYDHDKAIEWADGYGFYYLNGVEFTKDQWQKIVDEQMTLEDLAKGIFTAVQRAVIVQMLRPDRLLEQVQAIFIDTGKRGTRLYRVDNFFDTGETEYCMLMDHPSVEGKQYIEWVHPDVGKQGSADLAQAKADKITLSQYLEAIIA